MDTETLAMLRSSLEHVLTEASDRPLGARLDDLGWDEVLADDAPGALRLLFETKGRTLAGGDALGAVLGRALGMPDATVVLPASLHPDRPSATADGDAVHVVGAALTTAAIGTPVLVPVGRRLALVEAGPGWSWVAAEHGTDPSLGLVSVDGAASAVRWLDGTWDAAVAAGRWAVSAELVGIAQHVLSEAVRYAGERVQYGRPIGTFQALQHRLASAYSTVLGAGQVVAEAAADGSPWTALVAKALAGRAAEEACTQAQQVYGAIGFTWEHEHHRYLRRTYALDWLLGDWRTLEHEIGARLQDTAIVPRVGEL
jgi:hypothetical protein